MPTDLRCRPREDRDLARVRRCRRTMAELAAMTPTEWTAWLAEALPGVWVSTAHRWAQVQALQLLQFVEASPTGHLYPVTWSDLRRAWTLALGGGLNLTAVTLHGVVVTFRPPERRRQKGGV